MVKVMRPVPDEVQRITVVGAGTMGHSIAQVFAQAGIDVDLVDLDEAALTRAPKLVESNLQILVDAGRLDSTEVPAVLGRLHPTTSLAEAAARAEFAMEAVNERISTKQAVVDAFEDAAAPDVVLASNTSALDIFAQVTASKPERFVCAHWIMPPYIIPLVEVAGGPDSSSEALEWTAGLLRRVGKRPLVMKRFAIGFIANKIMMAMGAAAEELINDGAATIEDIDFVMKTSVGVRLGLVGLFQSLDFNGLDLIAEGTTEMGLAVPPYLKDVVDRGFYGPKTGRGFYDYGGRSESEVLRKRDLAYLAVLDALEAQDAFSPM